MTRVVTTVDNSVVDCRVGENIVKSLSFWSELLNGCTSATGRPVGVASTSDAPFILPRPLPFPFSFFADSLFVVLGGEPE